MLKKIFIYFCQILVYLAIALIPIAWYLYHINDYGFYEAIIKALVAALVIAVFLRVCLLPAIGNIITETLFSAHSFPDEAKELALARNLLAQGKLNEACQTLEQYAKNNPGYLKAWDAYISFLLDPMKDYKRAVAVMEECSQSKRWNAEDRAWFLYRCGKIYENHLSQHTQAVNCWQKAAKKYPKTAFGREAANKLAHPS